MFLDRRLQTCRQQEERHAAHEKREGKGRGEGWWGQAAAQRKMRRKAAEQRGRDGEGEINNEDWPRDRDLDSEESRIRFPRSSVLKFSQFLHTQRQLLTFLQVFSRIPIQEKSTLCFQTLIWYQTLKLTSLFLLLYLHPLATKLATS